MPQIKSNFILKSKSPNFERDSFETKFAMKDVDSGHMDEGHISYCLEDGKHYVFNSNNIYDIETGFFKVFATESDNNIPEDLQNRLLKLENGQSEMLNMINELYVNNFPITLSFSASPNIVEYTGTKKASTLKINIKYKNEELDRQKLTNLSIITDNSSDLDTYNLYSSAVNVTLKPNSNANHTFNLFISTDNQTKSASCTIYQRAPFFVGWSLISSPTTDLCVDSSTSLITKKVATSTAGNYIWNDVPAESFLWVLIPDGVNKYSKITSSGFDVNLIQQDNIIYRDVVYKCYRSADKISASGAGKWNLIFT